MKSRFEPLRAEAIRLRTTGISIGAIERILSIPRSTLSGWFRTIELTSSQKEELERRWKEGLGKARKEAVLWHNAQKKNRIETANEAGRKMLENLNMKDEHTVELALAFLYLGEGAKKSSATALGSSDPLIARFFVQSIKRLYGVPPEKFRCFLHLRADQDPELLKQYWATELQLSVTNFGKTSVDARTAGRPTYPHYKGVCSISCGQVEIQRRLMYIAKSFCEAIVSDAPER